MADQHHDRGSRPQLSRAAGWLEVAILVHSWGAGRAPDTLRVWRNQQFRWNKGYAHTARKLIPLIWRMKLPLERKIEAFLHLGGPSFALLKIAETPLWAIDIARHVLLDRLAPDYGVRPPTRDRWIVDDSVYEQEYSAAVARRPAKPRILGAPGITIFTIGMHSYAGATTTRGVLQALIGRDSAFVRTPKRGPLVGPDSAASRGRPFEDRPRSGAPRRQSLSRMVRRFSKRALG
jgi:hypothetical protein